MDYGAEYYAGGVGLNTKQVEELTGMSRQNIRYYERQGLLEPAREDGNAYRDYSGEDVRRLKLIKMLRMLDMPLKEIENVINGTVSIQEAAARQQEELEQRQRQLHAAISVCGSLRKEKDGKVDVDGYLDKMEKMSGAEGGFARFMDDYKKVVLEEQEKMFSFYADGPVNTSAMFERELRRYASEQGMKFRMIKKGRYPQFLMGTDTYTAVRVVEKNVKNARSPSVKIICERKNPGESPGKIPERRRRAMRGIHIVAVNIRRHRRKSILNLVLSLLSVTVLAFYLGNIGSTRRMIAELPEEFTITGEIWNMCGELNHGLFISHQVLEDLYGSPLISEIAESAELMGQMEDSVSAEEEEGVPDDVTLVGVNRMECIEGMTKEDIVWERGMDWEKFQESSDACLVSESFVRESGITVGEDLRFNLERYSQGLAGVTLTREELTPEVFHVAGTYKEIQGRDGGNPDVLLPLDLVKSIYERNNIVYFASALSFKVADPMHLDEVKRELEDAGMKEIIYGSPNSYVGISVKLTDSVFIRSMESADRSRVLLESFLPFIFLIVAAAGYIIPSLLFQDRREEYAVMRALGTGRYFGGSLFFAEHILPAFVGALAGAVLAAAAGAVDFGGMLLVWGTYMAVYMLGAAAAMWKFGRFSIAAVLAHRD